MIVWQRIREPVLSLFIVFNLFCLILILIPKVPGNEFLLSARLPFMRYLLATGLFQGKGVFVPRPHVYNVQMSAEVVYSDGTMASWKNVELTNMSPSERYIKARWRLWGMRNLNTNVPLPWWTESARWIARKMKTADKTPVKVLLERNREDTPPPEFSSMPPATIHQVILEYTVKPEDLL